MAVPASSREEILLQLFDLFRRAGYEGVSIGDISDATGLGRSSLYHYFPGGKADMAAGVIDFAKAWIDDNIIAPLKEDAPIAKRLDTMVAAARALYEGGKAPCLVASLLITRGDEPGVKESGALLAGWIDALAAALRGEGVPRAEAEARAVAALIAIEGALIVARATGRTKLFDDALKQARAKLGAGLS
jgi:AcrR family transcriptional regulator